MPNVARSFRGGDIRAEATGHRLCPGKVWALPGTQLARFPHLMCLPALSHHLAPSKDPASLLDPWQEGSL